MFLFGLAPFEESTAASECGAPCRCASCITFSCILRGCAMLQCCNIAPCDSFRLDAPATRPGHFLALPSPSQTAHFDSGRNFIAMVTGHKRYVILPPRACKALELLGSGVRSNLGCSCALERHLFRPLARTPHLTHPRCTRSYWSCN